MFFTVGAREALHFFRLTWHCPHHRARPFRELYALNSSLTHMPLREVLRVGEN